MATTDARAGFRLPWSSDRPSSESSDGESPNQAAAASGWPTEDGLAGEAAVVTAPEAVAAPDAPEAVAAPDAPGAVDPFTAPVGADAGPAPAAPAAKPPTNKKPSRFMADLTRAMQAAAEDARSRSISQLQADAKTHVETIHGRSSTEAAGLRRAADDDVAGVREWSKAEIARIREETETRITDRKARLENEIEQHAAVIEREIDAVQKSVGAFEDEMAAFFERLLGEEDPSRFATMAENLPEPPTFDGLLAALATDEAEAVEAVVETESASEEAGQAEAAIAGAAEAIDVEAAPRATDESLAATDEMVGSLDGAEESNGELDRESAFVAIQAAAEAAASAGVEVETTADNEADPRFAALGLSPDYDAAEAEAFADAGGSDEDIPEIGDDALAARIAGLVPGKDNADKAPAATQIVVVGLVSVASIASFKRHLGRLAGVRSVGVSSGPDGEFVFAVNHEDDTNLRDAIPSLPSFQARVTGSSEGIVHVTAHDPESDA